jgi:2-polyprenyl-6-hydroxyphenyl methylase/3-demethylubiquinone-9 3-methyltransferase
MNDRFEFGANWSRFLATIDEERIAEAERSLREMLGAEALADKTFLDIGSGSGLFSLAAMRLGAGRVHSLDFDPASVACTAELRRRYFPGSGGWTVERASVLDSDHMRELGRFDVVYAWGVLHHTGALRQALDVAADAVAPGGVLFLSIYNDQGWKSRAWRSVKRLYNRLPRALRPVYVALVMAPRELAAAAIALARLRPGAYRERWTGYARLRGMSRWRDMVDWVGGYPYEVARPAAILEFGRDRGFALDRMVTRSVGCNEFVFAREREGVPR